MSRRWEAEDRIRRCMNELEKILQEVEGMKEEKEKSRKEEIEEFFEKLNAIRVPFSIADLENVMSVHFEEGEDKGKVLIAIDREKAGEII